MARMVGVAAATAAVLWPAAAAAGDLMGPWVVRAEFGAQFQYTLLCGFSGAGPDVSGPCVAILGKPFRATGRQSPDTLRLEYDTDFNGSGVHMEYMGKVRPDGAVQGRIDTGTSEGMFSGAALAPSAWKLDVAFSAQLKYGVVCMFGAAGAKLKGPCGISTGPVLSAKGGAVAAGGDASFGYDTLFQGQPVRIVYQGRLQPDGSIKGVVQAGGAQGAFVATRP